MPMASLAPYNLPLLIAACGCLAVAALLLWRGRGAASANTSRLHVGAGLLLAALGAAGLWAGLQGSEAPAPQPMAARMTASDCEVAVTARLRERMAGQPRAERAPASEQPRSAIGLVSGTEGGTYHAVADDLVSLAGRRGVLMFNRTSNGGLSSLDQLADSQVNAALGFVQSDLLAWLRRSRDNGHQQLARELRLVAPLFAEEVHVLARREITSFEQLQGRRVLTASSSEGSRHTAENLLQARRIQPASLANHLTFAQAACAVITGQADALIAVAGRPMLPMQALEALLPLPGRPLDNVHLLPLVPVADDLGYERAELTTSDYAWQPATVQTLAVRAVLVAMDFAPNGSAYRKMRCGQLAQIGDALRHGLPSLRSPPFHPKWADVDWNRPVPGWPLDACSAGLGAKGARAG